MIHKAKGVLIAVLWGITQLSGLGSLTMAGQEFEEYTNLAFKFSTQIPRHWKRSITQKGDMSWLIFTGPRDTGEFETNLRFQVVAGQSNDTLESQANALERIWGLEPGYLRLSRETGKLSGQLAVRLVVTLQERDNKRVWKLEYFIAQKGLNFYVIGYEAPQEIFDKGRYVINKTIATFRFIEDTPGPSGPASQPPRDNRRIYDIQTAPKLIQGRPAGTTKIFPAGTRQVFVWFRFQGITAGTELRSVWVYLGGDKEQNIIEAKVITGSASDQGNFLLEMPVGKSFPAGNYRVDLLIGAEKMESAHFNIQNQ